MSLRERRLRRIEALQARFPESAEILRFYRAVLELQAAFDPAASAEANLPRVLDVVRRAGPPAMARWGGVDDLLRARAEGDPLARWLHILADPPSGRGPSPEASSSDVPARCPGCGEPPLAAVLRDDREAETLRRTLACPRCAREWAFPRVVCPSCGEERPEKLPRFSAADLPWLRIDACETCSTYLKAVDLSREPEAEPMVDDLASAALDLVARERGFTRLAPNLAGL